VESDSLTSMIAQALAALIRYVESRLREATTDDDVRAFEDVAHVLQQAPPVDRLRLHELLGEEMQKHSDRPSPSTSSSAADVVRTVCMLTADVRAGVIEVVPFDADRSTFQLADTP